MAEEEFNLPLETVNNPSEHRFQFYNDDVNVPAKTAEGYLNNHNSSKQEFASNILSALQEKARVSSFDTSFQKAIFAELYNDSKTAYKLFISQMTKNFINKHKKQMSQYFIDHINSLKKQVNDSAINGNVKDTIIKTKELIAAFNIGLSFNDILSEKDRKALLDFGEYFMMSKNIYTKANKNTDSDTIKEIITEEVNKFYEQIEKPTILQNGKNKYKQLNDMIAQYLSESGTVKKDLSKLNSNQIKNYSNLYNQLKGKIQTLLQNISFKTGIPIQGNIPIKKTKKGKLKMYNPKEYIKVLYNRNVNNFQNYQVNLNYQYTIDDLSKKANDYVDKSKKQGFVGSTGEFLIKIYPKSLSIDQKQLIIDLFKKIDPNNSFLKDFQTNPRKAIGAQLETFIQYVSEEKGLGIKNMDLTLQSQKLNKGKFELSNLSNTTFDAGIAITNTMKEWVGIQAKNYVMTVAPNNNMITCTFAQYSSGPQNNITMFHRGSHEDKNGKVKPDADNSLQLNNSFIKKDSFNLLSNFSINYGLLKGTQQDHTINDNLITTALQKEMMGAAYRATPDYRNVYINGQSIGQQKGMLGIFIVNGRWYPAFYCYYNFLSQISSSDRLLYVFAKKDEMTDPLPTSYKDPSTDIGRQGYYYNQKALSFTVDVGNSFTI